METVGRIMNNPNGCQTMAHDKSLISQKRTCKFSNLRMLERLGMLENTKKAPEFGGFFLRFIEDYKFPRNSCSRSIDSKRALKFPFPKLLAPMR